MSQPYYDIGKATLTAGSDIMTGQGTLWVGNARPGDQVVSYSGHTAIVGEVVSNTQIKLKRPYRGTNQAAQVYEILYTPDDPYTQTIARGILHKIAQSALVKLGEVTPAPRQLVRFDQAGNAALSPLSDYMLTLLAATDGPTAYGTLGPIPNAQVRGDLPSDKAFRRGNILGTVSQSGGVPTGGLVERGNNANGEYVRWADGTQECVGRGMYVSSAYAQVQILFPASFASNAPAIYGNATASTKRSAAASDYSTLELVPSPTATWITASGMQFRLRESYGVGVINTEIQAHYYARGRWY